MDDILRNVIGGLVAAIVVLLASATLSLLWTVVVAAAVVMALLVIRPVARWLTGRLGAAWQAILTAVNRPAKEKQDELEDRIATLETLLRSIQMRLASSHSGGNEEEPKREDENERR